MLTTIVIPTERVIIIEWYLQKKNKNKKNSRIIINKHKTTTILKSLYESV